MRFTFDEFVLDTGARELCRSGAGVHLSPKAFELLQALIERRPTAVGKDELHRLLWPATFVTDSSLATVVNELRTALGDAARRPRYIRTVHAYGYAFRGQAIAASHPPELAGARYWIQWEDRRVPLPEGEHIVGRAAVSTIVLDWPEVSRRHARIVVSPDGATLEDLGSRNGTFVGATRIAMACSLRDRDEITIGPATLIFHTVLDGATTKPNPGRASDPAGRSGLRKS